MHVARGAPPSIEGLCDRRFAAVRDAFASNFVERGEVGAAVAVSVAGRGRRRPLGWLERPLGPNAGAFGHFGAGGSLGFCDPEADLAFGYVMNDMGPRWQNPRNRALIDAVYACL